MARRKSTTKKAKAEKKQKEKKYEHLTYMFFLQPSVVVIGVPVLHPAACRGGEPAHGVVLP